MQVFRLTNFLKYYTIGQPDFVQGHYVYEWCERGTPFYIGMGINRRAWNEHLPYIEDVRRNCKTFQVRIYRHMLNKSCAHGIERFRIKELTRRGVPLLNTRKPQC